MFIAKRLQDFDSVLRKPERPWFLAHDSSAFVVRFTFGCGASIVQSKGPFRVEKKTRKFQSLVRRQINARACPCGWLRKPWPHGIPCRLGRRGKARQVEPCRSGKGTLRGLGVDIGSGFEVVRGFWRASWPACWGKPGCFRLGACLAALQARLGAVYLLQGFLSDTEPSTESVRILRGDDIAVLERSA